MGVLPHLQGAGRSQVDYQNGVGPVYLEVKSAVLRKTIMLSIQTVIHEESRKGRKGSIVFIVAISSQTTAGFKNTRLLLEARGGSRGKILRHVLQSEGFGMYYMIRA
jgi:hypothetical protein